MWPWEHLAFAYVCYSLVANLGLRRSPSTREAIAVAVASQFPDLVDKPLAWSLGIVEAGYAVAHSAFVAPVVCLGAVAVAARRGDRALAGAFSIAYGSHLVGDLVYPILRGQGFDLRIVLWPLATPPADEVGGFADHVVGYLLRYVFTLLVGRLTPQIAFQLLLGGTVLVLWLSDGAPIVADAWRAVRERRQSR
ncbi:metal-dependent hydrolase [Natrinema salifodinae]|uniref:LexA-binding, inner membrane-associated putative hydrolase n=1 Tax=Natrinema salifodinae TaxID=1202768 RepID=A0A1I0NCQ1_9EURY|nr:metal-dependent hydrolase [Natrinema salifodinae]SEV99036.1 LexA-binding, inner membrane-associated putative hydrolase [Natrinema salifodinae]